MRLAIFIFVCFAASTAVNSTQTNYSGALDETEKPVSNADLSTKFSPTRQLRQGQVDQPDWCMYLHHQSAEEVMTNCKAAGVSLLAPEYVLRIDKNVAEETWKKFIENAIGIMTSVEIADSSLTEIIMTVQRLGENLGDSNKMVISNNPKLKSVNIKGKEGIELTMHSSLWINRNPALKSIRIEAKEYLGYIMRISENDELETIEFNVSVVYSGFLKYEWAISDNPKLRRIQINYSEFWIPSPFHIVRNEALTELNFSETTVLFIVEELHINDNDNLETIKFPPGKFTVPKLEIRRNYKLNAIDLGEETRWNKTELIVRENPLLPSSVLETLKKIQWRSKDIQEVGEETAAITTDINLIDSSMPELKVVVDYTDDNKMIIKNNQKLERIIIKPKKGSDLRMGQLEIQGNPVLKSVKIMAEKYNVGGLTVNENGQLETIQFNVLEFHPAKVLQWMISNNPKLRRIQLRNCRKITLSQPLHIVGNKALTELQFPETMEQIELSTGLHINDNDNLESIKIPVTRVKFLIQKLEIRKNDKLKTIDLGEQTRWRFAGAIVRENPLLSAESLEKLKNMPWGTNDIQAVGEGELTTTTTTTTTATTTTPPAPPVNPPPAKPVPANPGKPAQPVNPGGNAFMYPKIPGYDRETELIILLRWRLIVMLILVGTLLCSIAIGVFCWRSRSKRRRDKMERKRRIRKQMEQAQNVRREEPLMESPTGKESTSKEPL